MDENDEVDELDLTAETMELTAEQIVAADMAMLLDVGGPKSWPTASPTSRWVSATPWPIGRRRRSLNR